MKFKTGVSMLALLLTLCASNIVYPLSGVVVEVNTETNETIIEDTDGVWWTLEGIERTYTGGANGDTWQVGDIVSMIMYDNGTGDFIEDDIVLTSRYDGNIERYMEIAGK